VIGAGVTARRIERRALHRRTTKVGHMRTLRRTCGTRHPGCLRGRE
jgi:predicted alpha/beta hydrolase